MWRSFFRIHDTYWHIKHKRRRQDKMCSRQLWVLCDKWYRFSDWNSKTGFGSQLIIDCDKMRDDFRWCRHDTPEPLYFSLPHSRQFVSERHWPSTSHAWCFHTRVNYEENTSRKISSTLFSLQPFFFFGWDNLRAMPSSSTSGRHWQNVKAILGKNVESSKKSFLNLSFILCVWKFSQPLFALRFPFFPLIRDE